MKKLLRERAKLVLDTSVLVEYIVKNSPYRHIVEELIKAAVAGKLKLFINYITLSETLYVVSRIYQLAGVRDPNNEALNYVMWLKRRVTIVDIDENIALRAGELRKKLRIALPDCYVIASSEALNAIPLFRKIKKEMEPVEDTIRNLGVKFLK